MAFKPVLSTVDFPSLERELLDYWYQGGIAKKYLHKSASSDKKFSFLDGPITANNPMGVHHGWGRTYKDLWQRFFNMKGYKQRFQNGFDEQGLWVEVEVEKELGLKSKKDIENLVPGNKFASLEKFVNLCKARVKKYSAIQTEQSKRLGYFMDWDNSYHTSSDENNYWIWHFLKIINEKGWLYKGRDSVPWCPRCGTAISQHEILTEEYQKVSHLSVYFRLPLKGEKNKYLLVWTTTPWTIPANVAVAVDPNMEYTVVVGKDGNYIVAKDMVKKIFGDVKVGRDFKGKELVGLNYAGPFDNLPAVGGALGSYQNKVIGSDPLILPISTEEGTGLVHIAPGAGAEDFALGKKENLPVIAPLDESAGYVDGFDFLSGLAVSKANPKIIKHLKDGGFLFKQEEYIHRYPTCWRCKNELVFRVVDEWYIAMDKKDSDGKTYREQMIDVAKKINWIPKWGLERELDWLKNMHDWLISKKRYWGLSLPIWECGKCGNFEVIGSKDELKERAVAGWNEFAGHSPHRPWIDQVEIKCLRCGEVVSRIADVGNPWLDAGIVPFSTMPQDWLPADFITEAFPGQFKNWFYSLIAMSTALRKSTPFKNLLGHAMVTDEKGELMHKSKGNAIEFNEAADKMGVDIIRWMYLTQNPENNLLFGYGPAGDIKRRFYLILWNSYKFFVDYANYANWQCQNTPKAINEKLTVLDRWILSKLTEAVFSVNEALKKFDAATASLAIEDFVVSDLSTWYIRRSRDRVGPVVNKEDETVFLATLYGVLVTLAKLLAPFLPFVSELIYQNLTEEESVHLSSYPLGDKNLIDQNLVEDMEKVRKLVEIGHAQRKKANIKLRQPLPKFLYTLPDRLSEALEHILADELNVKEIKYQRAKEKKLSGKLDTNMTPQLKEEGAVRELIRQIQQMRKQLGLTLADRINVVSNYVPAKEHLMSLLLKETNSREIKLGQSLSIKVVK